MIERHSVREYLDEPLSDDVVADLRQSIELLNEDHFLDMQLIVDEPRAFGGLKAKRAGFSNVRNYIVLVGPECKELKEVVGYAGEKLVLYAQMLGLNTCWVGTSYREVNRVYRVTYGSKLEAVIAIGYGQTPGTPHVSVSPEAVAPDYKNAPDWFKAGVDAALLAPTANNKQDFRFELQSHSNDEIPMVRARAKHGTFSKIDLGIAKLHFEIGAEPELFDWDDQ